MELIFGMAVVGQDGAEAGQLERVLVNPSNREVTHVVIRSDRVSEEVLLPLNLVQGQAGERLLLHLAAGDLENMPRYYEGRTSTPPAGRVDTSAVREPGERRDDLEAALNVPGDARELGPETGVRTADGVRGRLAGLTADHYANRLTEVRVGGLRSEDVMVQEAWIGQIESDEIRLAAEQQRLDRTIAPASGPYVARTSGEPRRVEERDQRQR